MRNLFDKQLNTLNKKLIEMGAMCEEVIALAAKSLLTGDTSLAKKISSLDREIDHLERDIETLCLKLLLQQQPVATDLRQISAALKMITDMERIGDQAADISDIIVYLDGRTGDECKYIKSMSETAIKMVTASVDAFVKRDMALVEYAITKDDEVDEYFDKAKAFLIKMVADKPHDGEYALDLLMIAKYFERIGDHAVNIAEWVAFSITGEHKGGD